MDDITRAIARNMFHLQIYEADGQKFEDIFSKIMNHKYIDFRQVCPYGNIGDKKNDGWIESEYTYFQVYAPFDIMKNINIAIGKVNTDFKGLFQNWNHLNKIKKFYFVLNDKFKGSPPQLQQELLSIKDEFNLEVAAVYTPKDLEKILFSLSDDVIISIIGHIPKVNDVDYMYISGFTYFIIAWINFEKTARDKISQNMIKEYSFDVKNNELMQNTMTSDRIYPVGKKMFNELRQKFIISDEDFNLLCELFRQRNKLVHGENLFIPKKSEIDKLIAITESMN